MRWQSRPGHRSLKLAVIAALLVGALPVRAAEGGPRIRFDQPSFDFGELYQEMSTTHDFTFRNVGEAPLRIGRVTSTCGCTAALPSRQEIPPGGMAAIKATFRSGRMRDRVTKHIYVESNDPVEPRAVLTLTGIVRVEVEVIPLGFYLGSVTVGQVIEREVLVRPVEAKRFRLFDPRSDNQAVRVSSPERLSDKQGGYRLKIRFGPVSEPTRVNAHVTVRTDLEHAKELRISVYGNVRQQPEPPPGGPAP